VALASAGTLPADFVEWQGRIVGGSTASAGQFPHQVSLTAAASRSHFCGGGLISTRWVLSAAHCTVGRGGGNTAIWAGTTSRTAGGVRFAVSRIINHGSYNSGTLVNDISLVESTAVMSGTNIATRGLSSAAVGGGVTVHISGWGQTSHPGSAAGTLQWLSKSTITNAACSGTGLPNIVASKLCAFSGRTGAGNCMGDSGGPLIQASNGIIVGVVSWGIACAQGFPDVYTRVSSFRAWISANSGV